MNNAHLSYNGYGYLVAVGLDNAFDSEIEGQLQKNLRGCVFNRRVRYQHYGNGTSMLVSIVEPHSTWGRHLANLLGMADFFKIEDFGGMEAWQHSPLELMERFFDSVAGKVQEGKRKRTDERITFILNHLKTNLGETIGLADVADLIHLSPERMRHLFKEQMGIPFTKYLLWQRLRCVLHAVTARQMRLNQAVGQFGFTDQAHFNHIFKNIFGVSPKVLFDMGTVLM